MPARNENLTNELDRLVASRVKSGRYANASEVVRSALRLLGGLAGSLIGRAYHFLQAECAGSRLRTR
jgi:Bacterial antitoxin of ParD toxin-antitoxin type II system and RHH